MLLLDITRSSSQTNTPSQTPTKSTTNIVANAEPVNVNVLITYWTLGGKYYIMG